MKHLKLLMTLSCLSVASFTFSQNYDRGYPQYPGYQEYPNYPMHVEVEYPQPYGQPGQFYGGNQPYPGQVYQGQTSQRSYSSQPGYQQPGYQQDDQSKHSEKHKGGWGNWFRSDDKNAQIPDQVISSRIIQNIRSTPYLSPAARNIQVDTKDGKVTLKGKAFNKNEGYQIEYMIKNIEGVKSVSNDLEYEK